MVEEAPDPDFVLARFNKLISDLLRGTMSRNSFQSWEIEILVDLDDCPLPRVRRVDTLKRYQRAVQRQLEKGYFPPMKLSEYLGELRRKAAS